MITDKEYNTALNLFKAIANFNDFVEKFTELIGGDSNTLDYTIGEFYNVLVDILDVSRDNDYVYDIIMDIRNESECENALKRILNEDY